MRDSSLARLDEVASLVTEKATTSKDPSQCYVGLEHLPSGGSKLLGFAEAGTSISTNNVFREGDVLFGKLRPRLRKSIRAPFEGYCSTDILVLRPTASVEPLFAAFVLQSDAVFGEAIRTEEGTKMPRCSWSTLRKLRVHCPETSAQQRIAEILFTVDEAIEQTEALIAKTQQIKAGLMHDLFTRGVTANGELRPPREEAPQLYDKWTPEYVPNSWDRELLGSVTPETSSICYGIVQPGEHKPDGIPVVAIYNLNVDFTTTHRSSKEIESAYVRSRIRGGDVLLSIKGSIGRVDVTPHGFVGNISRDVARIRPRPGIHPEFLRYALESASLQTALSRISVGTTRAELSIGRLKQVPVYLPREGEQVAIANRLVAVDERLRTERTVLEKLGHQKRGLMADLLSGRVPVPVSAKPNLKEVAANV